MVWYGRGLSLTYEHMKSYSFVRVTGVRAESIHHMDGWGWDTLSKYPVASLEALTAAHHCEHGV